MQSSSAGDDAQFRHTQLFHMLMKVLSSSAENATTTTTTPMPIDVIDSEAPSSESWGDESLVVAIVALGSIFALLTTVGNLMVMVSFKIDKQLQTISNYFLFSLAVADITIGVISIPMFTYYTAMNTWGIGYTMCQFWLCIDYLMSNASVLNLLLISFDRYFSVTRPLSYRPRRTTKKALTMIACTYIISMILWPPWIISWPYIEGKFTSKPGTCVVQFLQTNPYVTVGTAVAAFYLPVTIMIILYTRVYWETQKRQKEFGKLQASQFPRRSIKRDFSSNSIVKSSGSVRRNDWNSEQINSAVPSRTVKRKSWLRSCTGKSNSSSEDSSEAAVMNLDDTSLSSSLFAGKKRNVSPPCSPLPTNFETESLEKCEIETPARNGSTRFRTRTEKMDRPPVETYTVLIELNDEGARPCVRLSSCEPYVDDSPGELKPRSRSRSDCPSEAEERRLSFAKQSPIKNGRPIKSFSSSDRKSEKERRKNERKQESKAAKTLSAILCAFIATWTPYNLIVCWEAFFPYTVPNILWTISYFLCYINSTINPLCYALCNARFRHTYMRIIRCKFGPERPTLNQGFVRR
ncbi:unnamed protein product [Caenorhabditis auriculariae]|uniref:G-protein coupled receptors family 1 profile domain-containing protein n=1 Tax=Caenorhabditis auriculariae TaxID=2777116 RepID=A0A8S1HPH3_9PELO|nr:unnamed protein product [Caenorhabditis auriculariae]